MLHCHFPMNNELNTLTKDIINKKYNELFRWQPWQFVAMKEEILYQTNYNTILNKKQFFIRITNCTHKKYNLVFYSINVFYISHFFQWGFFLYLRMSLTLELIFVIDLSWVAAIPIYFNISVTISNDNRNHLMNILYRRRNNLSLS